MPGRDTSLRGVVARLATDPSSREDTLALVTFCHRMGVAYLRVKAAGGHRPANRFGLSAEDLAFDSIADLFVRDHAGTFPVIRSFVARVAPSGNEPEDLIENSLRRFVCSLVNRRIFELHRQFDPSLARIIRNIKLAALTHPDLTAGEHLGERVLLPRWTSHLNTRLPVMAPELLSSDLLARLEGPRTLARILSALSAVLTEQTLYRRLIPVTQAAVAVRSVLAPSEDLSGSPHDPWELTPGDVERIVDRTLDHVRRDKGPFYLDRARLTPRELDAHLAAVRDLLLRDFEDPGRDHISCYHVLRLHLGDLTPDCYAARHRCIFEYFMRCAKRTAFEYLSSGV